MQMSQLFTAQFIGDSGFLTGLTPTVTVNDALTGIEKGVFTMTETSVGNYIYYWNDGNDNVVYFAKYDAGTDDAINRYQGNNTKIETVVSLRSGGGSITNNNLITKEKMEEIAEMVVEKLPEQKEIVLDTSKIEEKLVLIDDKIEMLDTEIDYGTILCGQEKNTQKIIKKIENIKIPKIDDKKILNAIEGVKETVEKIEKIDILEMKEHTKKIKTKKEEKEEEKRELLEEELGNEILEESKKEDDDLIEKIIEEENIFNSLLDDE